VSAPEFLVGDVVDAGEVARVEGGFFPICAEERLEESEDFRGDPCGGVDAVSDVLDGDLDKFMQASLAQRVYGGGPDSVEDVD
jgi:hypothetical protein